MMLYGLPGGSGTTDVDVPANPTLNQAEEGRPVSTPYGRAYKKLVTACQATPRWKPGPYHFRPFAGFLSVPAPVSPRIQYLPTHGFRGTVSLAQAPKYQRLAPWLVDARSI